MHQEAGACIDFDHRAALFLQGLGDVLCDQVDAGNVQADHACGQGRGVSHFRMNVIGAINRQIAIAYHHHLAPGRGDGLRRVALALQLQHHRALFLGANQTQRKIFSVSATRITVDLGVDQLTQRAATIGQHRGGLAFGGGDHLAAYHQQAVFLASDVLLHHHFTAFGVGNGKCRFDVSFVIQIQAHATSVIAVGGFDDHGKANVLCGIPGCFR